MDDTLIYIIRQQQPYSYLLRIWRSGDGSWRASLQSVQTGERHMFASIESLCTFLAAIDC